MALRISVSSNALNGSTLPQHHEYLWFRSAWLWARQGGDYTVFCLLVFAACIMMTGVDTLIDRPRDQWMLFWFPIALLLAYQGSAGRAGND